jgi:hypothetical protein
MRTRRQQQLMQLLRGWKTAPPFTGAAARKEKTAVKSVTPKLARTGATARRPCRRLHRRTARARGISPLRTAATSRSSDSHSLCRHRGVARAPRLGIRAAIKQAKDRNANALLVLQVAQRSSLRLQRSGSTRVSGLVRMGKHKRAMGVMASFAATLLQPATRNKPDPRCPPQGRSVWGLRPANAGRCGSTHHPHRNIAQPRAAVARILGNAGPACAG